MQECALHQPHPADLSCIYNKVSRTARSESSNDNAACINSVVGDNHATQTRYLLRIHPGGTEEPEGIPVPANCRLYPRAWKAQLALLPSRRERVDKALSAGLYRQDA